MVAQIRIVFVNYHRFEGSSGIHIFHLANTLSDLGVNAEVVVPNDKETARDFGTARFSISTFEEKLRRLSGVEQSQAPGENETTLYHVWTPREGVRRFIQQLRKSRPLNYLVHLEDNEGYIAKRRGLRRRFLSVFRKFPAGSTHPRRSQRFLEEAIGVTCIVDSLRDFAPKNRPCRVIYPACEPEVFGIPLEVDRRLRQSLGISSNRILLFYPGNAHAANQTDMECLYGAIDVLWNEGLPIQLIRSGTDYVTLDNREVGIEKGWLDHRQIPEKEFAKYLSMADILVQPGGPNAFNNYRFPSKLPMFLASGRPVVMPEISVSCLPRDGMDCLLLREGSQEELVRKIRHLACSPELAKTIGEQGRCYAAKNFSWRRSAENLLAFYQELLRN